MDAFEHLKAKALQIIDDARVFKHYDVNASELVPIAQALLTLLRERDGLVAAGKERDEAKDTLKWVAKERDTLIVENAGWRTQVESMRAVVQAAAEAVDGPLLGPKFEEQMTSLVAALRVLDQRLYEVTRLSELALVRCEHCGAPMVVGPSSPSRWGNLRELRFACTCHKQVQIDRPEDWVTVSDFLRGNVDDKHPGRALANLTPQVDVARERGRVTMELVRARGCGACHSDCVHFMVGRACAPGSTYTPNPKRIEVPGQQDSFPVWRTDVMGVDHLERLSTLLVCGRCGASPTVANLSEWRYTGKNWDWEHKCPDLDPQAGHVPVGVRG